MHVRPLTPADLDAVEPLVVESEADGFRFLRRIRREFDADASYLDSARTVVIGVFDGARLVAVGGLTPDPYVDDPAVGRVRHVYVARDFRRRGAGRRLIRAIEERALNAYTRLRLRTDTASAAAFYEELSYVSIDDPHATHTQTL